MAEPELVASTSKCGGESSSRTRVAGIRMGGCADRQGRASGASGADPMDSEPMRNFSSLCFGNALPRQK